MLRRAGLALLVVTLAGCGHSGTTDTATSTTTGAVSASATTSRTPIPFPDIPIGSPAPTRNRAAGLVEKSTWTDGPWPFTVDVATLMCSTGAANTKRVAVAANRELYALNGAAKSAHVGPWFDPIWANNPTQPGLKIDIGPMIERGLALCD